MKKKLIAWSGGVDSTALVIDALSKGIPFDTVYVMLPNNVEQQERELKSRAKILKKLQKLYKGSSHCKDHVIKFVAILTPVDDILLIQPFIWATSIIFNIDLTKYSSVEFGYIHGDSFWRVSEQFENLIISSNKLIRPDYKQKIKIRYPLGWHKKSEVIENFYKFNDRVEKLLKHTISCESAVVSDDCKCNKCV